jgi:hypothetical protein
MAPEQHPWLLRVVQSPSQLTERMNTATLEQANLDAAEFGDDGFTRGLGSWEAHGLAAQGRLQLNGRRLLAWNPEMAAKPQK